MGDRIRVCVLVKNREVARDVHSEGIREKKERLKVDVCLERVVGAKEHMRTRKVTVSCLIGRHPATLLGGSSVIRVMIRLVWY
jgi:hypothetical protein